MSKVLEAVYASVTDDVQYHTLEIPHDSFPGGVYRWVMGYEDIELGLETGETVLFEAAPLGVSLPERGVRGNQELQFQLDNVTGEALRAISKVIHTGNKLPVIYRVYLDSNKSHPAQAAIRMTATGFSADYHSVKVIADFHDFVNKRWPRLRYDLENAPGLKYI